MNTTKLFLGCLLVLSMLSANAFEVFNYKQTGGSIIKRSMEELNATWSSDTPACIKDGGKIRGVNKAFKTKKLTYGDCSASDTALAKQELLGYKVEVIRLVELPSEVAKQLLGIK